MNSICDEDFFVYSKHAKTRMSQRAIKKEVIDFILQYGRRSWAGGGCEEYAVSEKTYRKLDAEEYDKETISAAVKVRVIVSSEGNVVTCYFKYKHRSCRRLSRRWVNRRFL